MRKWEKTDKSGKYWQRSKAGIFLIALVFGKEFNQTSDVLNE